MCNRFILFPTIFLFFSWAPMFAQTLSFHHLSTDDNLSESVNQYVRRDSHGYMWISSTEGLNRFDGNNVVVYNESNNKTGKPLYGNNILSAVYEDSRQDLWFSTEKALLRYNRATNDFDHTLIAGDTLHHYYPFFLDTEGFFWVNLDGKGVYRVNTSTVFNRPVSQTQFWAGHPNGTDYYPVADPETGRLTRIYTINRRLPGVFEYTVENDTLRLLRRLLTVGPNGRDSLMVNGLAVTREGILWAGTNKGLVNLHIDNGQTQWLETYQGVSLQEVVRIAVLSANELALATRGKGLMILNTLKNALNQYLHSETNGYSIAGNRLENIYYDAQQSTLWLTIWGQGVDYTTLGKPKFDQIRLSNLSGNPNDPLFVPGALWPYENKGVWCASPLSSGLRLLDLNAHLIKDYSAQTGRVFDVCSSPQGATFFCTEKGLLCKRANEEKFIAIDGEDKFPPWQLFKSRNGQIYVVSYDSGLYHITNSEHGYFTKRLKDSPLNNKTLSRLYEDAAGRGYGESDKDGLLIFEGPVAEGRILKTDPAVRVIKCFAENSSHVWAVGAFGLLRINKQTLETKLFDERQGLPTKVIYSILPVGDEALWLGTNRGLVRYDLRNNHFDSFDMADGLQGKEYNTGSCLIAPDGRYWFGGVKGINIFKADDIRLISTPPFIQITDLNINDLPYVRSNWFAHEKLNPCELDNLFLDYDENTLTFYLAALEYSDPKNNKVYYRLEPLDTAWVEMPSSSYVRFSKLSPNNYRLVIRGQNSDGIPSENPRILNIVISPPFYKTIWFITLIGLLLFGVIVLIVGEGFRREQLKRKMAQLNLQSLSTQLFNHFFGNTMATLSNLIGDNPNSAKAYLLNLSSFLREVLTLSRKMTVRLDEEIDLIRSYLKWEEHRFEPGKLEYQLPDEEDIDPEGFKVPSMMLQPFVENSIVHGLRERGYGKITVSTFKDKDHVVCIVHDNGVGRNKETVNQKRLSHGIDIVRQHIQLYDQEYGTHSSLEINDLVDDAQQPSGTRVTISLGIPAKRKKIFSLIFRQIFKRYL